ncbi:MAG: deoxyribonuclease IV, partial [Patescibacteria group bacterium]
MLFGAHISSAGGLENAPERASLIGCEVFQMFSRSPQIWKAPELKDETVELFNENMKKFNQKECYIHTSFLINLASVNNKIRHGSMNIIKEELERGSRLGAKYVMTHLGSYKDVDSDLEGPMMVVDALKKILDKEYFTELLIEISAGAGNIVGCTFEELAYFMEELKGYKVGICLATAHMFASGYDLRNKKAVTTVFDVGLITTISISS